MCRRHMLKIVDNHLSLIPVACPSTSNHPFQSHGRCCHCCPPSRCHRPCSQVQRRASLSQADDDKEPSAVADSRERASSRVIVGSGMRFFCQLPSFVCVCLCVARVPNRLSLSSNSFHTRVQHILQFPVLSLIN